MDVKDILGKVGDWISGQLDGLFPRLIEKGISLTPSKIILLLVGAGLIWLASSITKKLAKWLVIILSILLISSTVISIF